MEDAYHSRSAQVRESIQPNHYRGISPIFLVMKLCNKMIMNRMRPVLNPLLRTPKRIQKKKDYSRTDSGPQASARRCQVQ